MGDEFERALSEKQARRDALTDEERAEVYEAAIFPYVTCGPDAWERIERMAERIRERAERPIRTWRSGDG